MFERLRSGFEIDGPSVDTQVDTAVARPGGAASGRVRIQGGKEEIFLEKVVLGLVAQAHLEIERRSRLVGVSLHHVVAREGMWVRAGERVEIPFTLPVPWDTPITAVGGAVLPVLVGVRTELVAIHARDASDLDPVVVQPLPSQSRVLDAFGQLGAAFTAIDGTAEGSLNVGFPLVLRFEAPWRFATAVKDVGLTFAADERQLGVSLVATRRGGLLRAGQQVLGSFVMTHEQAEVADWTSLIGGWLTGAAR